MKHALLFSRALKRLMDEREMKPAQLARETGLSHVAIGNYLKGRLPELGPALILARYFGRTVDEMISGLPSMRQELGSMMQAMEDPAPYGSGAHRESAAERKLTEIKRGLEALLAKF